MLSAAPTRPNRSFFSSRLVVRLVVVAVPGPGEAVHHVLVARPRDAFHRGERGEHDQRGREPVHARLNRSFGRSKTAPLELPARRGVSAPHGQQTPHALRKDLGRARRRAARATAPALIFIDRHLVHEVTSPQAFEALRLNGPQGAPPRPDAGGARPQPADHRADRRRRQPRADRRPRKPRPARRARAQRARVRHALLRRHRARAGHRPRRRARAGLLAPRHDDRLRRQPHRRARRDRRAGVRHRHQRGRARAGDADAAAARSRRRWKCASRASSARASPRRT